MLFCDFRIMTHEPNTDNIIMWSVTLFISLKIDDKQNNIETNI